MRLIDADALMADYKEAYRMGECYCDKPSIIGLLNAAPTIEAEPIVRCGECKWYFENENYETLDTIPFCDHPEGGGVTKGKQWHCADGDRKERR